MNREKGCMHSSVQLKATAQKDVVALLGRVQVWAGSMGVHLFDRGDQSILVKFSAMINTSQQDEINKT